MLRSRRWSRAGVSADSIAGLGDLVRLDHFRKILRHRFEEAGRKPNNFNRDLAEALIQIAREWVKADPADLAELERLSGKMPMLPKGLTPKTTDLLPNSMTRRPSGACSIFPRSSGSR